MGTALTFTERSVVVQEYLTDEEKSILCLRCHECCKQLPISMKYEPNSEAFKQMSEFFRAHGCEARVIHGTYVISIPHVCQYLTTEGCTIYKERPQVCRNYDGRKDPRLFNKCLWNRRQPAEKRGMTSAAGYSDRAEVKII